MGDLFALVIMITSIVLTVGIWKLVRALQAIHADYRRVHARQLDRHSIGLSPD